MYTLMGAQFYVVVQWLCFIVTGNIIFLCVKELNVFYSFIKGD